MAIDSPSWKSELGVNTKLGADPLANAEGAQTTTTAIAETHVWENTFADPPYARPCCRIKTAFQT
jgi:hypothetical protein